MKNLIIPCAGQSKRFPNLPPKWSLLNDFGKCMVGMVVETYLDKFDRIVLTIIKDHAEKHDALNFLRRHLNPKVEILVLDSPTHSPSQTVFETIRQKNIEGDITIKDCDCHVGYKIPDLSSYIVGVNIKNNTSIQRLEAKSYIHKNDNNIISDIFEKKMVSNNICVGVYACSVDKFSAHYQSLINSDIFLGKQEIYVSHVFSHMILTGSDAFSYIEAESFLDWGTPDDWHQTKNTLSKT